MHRSLREIDPTFAMISLLVFSVLLSACATIGTLLIANRPMLDVKSNSVELSDRSIEEQSFGQCASLVAQRAHGVDAHRPPGGDRTCD